METTTLEYSQLSTWSNAWGNDSKGKNKSNGGKGK